MFYVVIVVDQGGFRSLLMIGMMWDLEVWVMCGCGRVEVVMEDWC